MNEVRQQFFLRNVISKLQYGDYKNRAWSNTELEFLEVWQQMQQAKEGYAGRSGARDFNWGTTGLYFGSQGPVLELTDLRFEYFIF
jgi:hypothetical protein